MGNKYFPNDVEMAIKEGFNQAETEFLQEAKFKGPENSGSCALIALVVNSKCYVANVGDSRAVLSMKKGEDTIGLTP